MKDDETCTCPTCGKPFTETKPRVNLDSNRFICSRGTASLTPQQAELLHALLTVYPQPARYAALLSALYGIQDGPNTPLVILRTQVSALRRSLKPFGWTINNVPKRGYILADAGRDV